MKVKERQKRIVTILQDKGEVSVEELATALNRSAETIRRDLSDLAESGLVQKIHGGVKLPSVRFENHFARRMQVNAEGKRAIGRTLAEMIKPGETIFMDSGSTTYYCAEALRDKDGICVIVNSFDIAEILGPNPNIQVIVIGGTYFADNRQLLGPLALRDVSYYRPDYAVITVGGIDSSGIMDFNLNEATLATAMVRHAKKTIVVADHHKIGRACAFKVGGLDQINILITDDDREYELDKISQGQNIKLHTASVRSSQAQQPIGGTL